MAALKCLAKYAEGSGFDVAWEVSGLCGSAQVRQILDGRHIYRGLEAHVLTLIALFGLYTQNLLSADEHSETDSALLKFHDFCRTADKVQSIKTEVKELHSALVSSGTLQKISCGFANNSSSMRQFLISYMRQVMWQRRSSVATHSWYTEASYKQSVLHDSAVEKVCNSMSCTTSMY
jgi:hypothetical protein